MTAVSVTPGRDARPVRQVRDPLGLVGGPRKDRRAAAVGRSDRGIAAPVDAAISVWAEALDRVWADIPRYGAAAQVEAARPERAPEHILEQFMAILHAL